MRPEVAAAIERRKQERLAQENANQDAAPENNLEPVTGETATAKINKPKNSVEISFAQEPSVAAVKELESKGFKYSTGAKVYYAKYTDELWGYAKEFVGRKIESTPTDTTSEDDPEKVAVNNLMSSIKLGDTVSYKDNGKDYTGVVAAVFDNGLRVNLGNGKGSGPMSWVTAYMYGMKKVEAEASTPPTTQDSIDDKEFTSLDEIREWAVKNGVTHYIELEDGKIIKLYRKTDKPSSHYEEILLLKHEGTFTPIGKWQQLQYSNLPGWYEWIQKPGEPGEPGDKTDEKGLNELASPIAQLGKQQPNDETIGTLPAIPDTFNSRKELYDWAVSNGVTTFKEGKTSINLYRGNSFVTYSTDNGRYIVTDRKWSTTTNPNLGSKLSEFDTQETSDATPDTTPAVGAGGFDGSQANRDKLKNKLLEKIGKKPVEKKVNIVDDSDAALEAALANLNNKLNKLSSTPFDPELMGAAFKVGAIYLQRGSNTLATRLMKRD